DGVGVGVGVGAGGVGAGGAPSLPPHAARAKLANDDSTVRRYTGFISIRFQGPEIQNSTTMIPRVTLIRLGREIHRFGGV
ncbi:hypothetical protein Q6280_28390, partial [Klebsiella pneumoniae]|uniref:hypothetical protein n=1 Tax=Klebsiella pneumoniae TaxID=573 RepID=UPI00272F3E22